MTFINAISGIPTTLFQGFVPLTKVSGNLLRHVGLVPVVPVVPDTTSPVITFSVGWT